MNAETTEYEADPKRVLRRCIIQTRWDLRRSIRRNRVIPLPTLLRLFKRRWAESGLSLEHQMLRRVGQEAIKAYYHRRQPFRPLE